MDYMKHRGRRRTDRVMTPENVLLFLFSIRPPRATVPHAPPHGKQKNINNNKQDINNFTVFLFILVYIL